LQNAARIPTKAESSPTGRKGAGATMLDPLAVFADFEPVALTGSIDPGPASHDRLWNIEQSILPIAELTTEGATVRNVRQCRWKSESEKDVRHSEWSFAWEDVQGADFVVVPFQNIPVLAHTMLSFRIRGQQPLVVSVEARMERGEVYSPLAGTARQYELMYVLGDEQDLYGLRAAVRGDDVYLYKTKADRQRAVMLLRDILMRVNSIAATPEYYDSLTNNCTTNIIDHVMQLRGNDPATLSALDQWRSRFPGNSDRMAFDLGLIDSNASFEQTRGEAWISSRVRQHLGEADFSARIRGRAGDI
jgi:hypothetical protein